MPECRRLFSDQKRPVSSFPGSYSNTQGCRFGFDCHDNMSFIRTCSVSAELLQPIQTQDSVTTDIFQTVLGQIASSAAVILHGLLMHMRMLQYWFQAWVPRWAWHRGTHRMTIMVICLHIFSPWSDLALLWTSNPLERCPDVLLAQDFSRTFWDAVCNRPGTGPPLH